MLPIAHSAAYVLKRDSANDITITQMFITLAIMAPCLLAGKVSWPTYFRLTANRHFTLLRPWGHSRETHLNLTSRGNPKWPGGRPSNFFCASAKAGSHAHPNKYQCICASFCYHANVVLMLLRQNPSTTIPSAHSLPRLRALGQGRIPQWDRHSRALLSAFSCSMHTFHRPEHCGFCPSIRRTR